MMMSMRGMRQVLRCCGGGPGCLLNGEQAPHERHLQTPEVTNNAPYAKQKNTFLNCRRLRPGLLRIANQLERVRHLQHAQVVKACTSNLQANRQTGAGVAAVD